MAIKDICYIEACGNYTQIHLNANQLLSTRITLHDMLQLLPLKQFIRIHRAFIVSKEKVSKFDRSQVWIGQTPIPVGATYLQYLQELS